MPANLLLAMKLNPHKQNGKVADTRNKTLRNPAGQIAGKAETESLRTVFLRLPPALKAIRNEHKRNSASVIWIGSEC